MSLGRKNDTRATVANALTAFRLLAAPGMLLCALADEPQLFLWLLVAAFASDAADGAAARLSGGGTPFGARFDSITDAITYTAIIISVVLLWPDLVRQEFPAVFVIVASLVLPAAAGLWKYGQLTSYHTRLVKLAVSAVAIGLLLMLCDVSVWPFRAAAILAACSAIEEVAITLLLREPKSDVPGLYAAWRGSRPT